MKAGVVYPQVELGGDTGAVKAFAQAAEDLGYDHIVIYDHVLGAVRLSACAPNRANDRLRYLPRPSLGFFTAQVRPIPIDRLGRKPRCDVAGQDPVFMIGYM